jgi:hypothetical protein
MLALGVATGTARGQGIPDSSATELQASGQETTTDQAATANADATDAEPTNVFVSLRVDSPGDNGPVSQTATTAVAGAAENDAATAQDAWQDWDSGGAVDAAPQASAQESDTDQAAASTATAARAKPTNVVVSIRVNSPGDDGPVTQSSTVAVASQAKNAAATAQKAQQAAAGSPGGDVATAAPAASPKPARGAVADQPAAAPPDAPAPPSCVSVAPGKATTRIVITLGATCHDAKRAPRPAARPVARKHVPAAARPASVQAPATAPALAPVEPVAHVVAAPAPAREIHKAAPKPAALPRPRAAEPKALDPLAASTRAGNVVAAATLPVTDVADGGASYALMLALLLATLAAAAVWSYGGAHHYRFRRRR